LETNVDRYEWKGRADWGKNFLIGREWVLVLVRKWDEKEMRQEKRESGILGDEKGARITFCRQPVSLFFTLEKQTFFF
jgi:hypothetical protein